MPETDNTETIATFERDGKTCEIDHLGVLYPDTQWGEFAVYCDGVQLSNFMWDYMNLPSTEVLIRLAREALALDEAAEVLGA